jgi:putative redox protein
MSGSGSNALTVTHEGGSRFRIRVREHELVVDQPVPAGGMDVGPTPTELFVGSIASCAAFYGRTYLARHGLPDQVDVTARWQVVPKPNRVGSVSLEVVAPGVPPDRRDTFHRVLESCLVHQTLRVGCDVRVDVQDDPRSLPLGGWPVGESVSGSPSGRPAADGGTDLLRVESTSR